jgi:hypothetical protein
VRTGGGGIQRIARQLLLAANEACVVGVAHRAL